MKVAKDMLVLCVRDLDAYFKRLPRSQEMSLHQLNSLDYLYKIENRLKRMIQDAK
jgi:hypothetical protein